mgnify:CR=1 FL=1
MEDPKEKETVLEKKRRKFLKYRFLFRLIPFLDFVIVAGSLALGSEGPPFGGNVHKDSDFDVIVGAKSGRIFTVRAFCVFVFGVLGLRRKGIDHKLSSSDKICFNHFVTSKSYRLSLPYNDYWIKLYQNLEPIYGKEEAVRDFFEANNWAPRTKIFNQKYWERENFSFVKRFLEFLLIGPIGNFFENFTKKIQTSAIKEGIKNGVLGYKPRIRYDDEELEFHPDTKRAEGFFK